MRLQLGVKTSKVFVSLSLRTVRRALGLYSLSRNNPLLHYGLFDFETKDKGDLTDSIGYIHYAYDKIHPASFDTFTYETKHGYHYLVFVKLPFIQLAKIMIECPHIDLVWFTIGLRRGYWFLENYSPIPKEIFDKYDLTFGKIERIG